MFITYEVARELINALAPLVVHIKREDRELADQMKRAAQSVLLNLAEGQKYSNGNRLRHYEIAQGSANEVKAALDAGVAWGWISADGSERLLLDRLLALMWKLTHSPALQTMAKQRTQASQKRT
jgi:four helix bundle protein